MRFCTNCGAELGDHANFCSNCGGKCVKVASKKTICKLCGSRIDDGALFCERCGEPCCTLEEWEAEQDKINAEIKSSSNESVAKRSWGIVALFFAVGLLAILFLPIAALESEWMEEWGIESQTIGFSDVYEEFFDDGIDSFDDIIVRIAIVTFTLSVVGFLCSFEKSKLGCMLASGITILFLGIQIVLFEEEAEKIFFLGEYLQLSLGFWISLVAHVLCFFIAWIQQDVKTR